MGEGLQALEEGLQSAFGNSVEDILQSAIEDLQSSFAAPQQQPYPSSSSSSSSSSSVRR